MSEDGYIVEAATQLFRSRERVYGINAGGRRDTETSPEELMWRHIHQEPIGLYSMIPNGDAWECWWGCVDYDIKSEKHKTYDYETREDAHVAAQNLSLVLSQFGIEGWMERTRSHGRHVWVFAAEPIPCVVMRNALLAASQIAGTSLREVNPKSYSFDDASKVGNYVNLPTFTDRFYDTGRKILRLDGRVMDVIDFLETALHGRSSLSEYARLAELYQPPARPTPVHVDRVLYGSMNGDPYMAAAISGGPAEGVDRSAWLVGIARKSAGRGHGVETTLEFLYAADDACGKYVARNDRSQRLLEIARIGHG